MRGLNFVTPPNLRNLHTPRHIIGMEYWVKDVTVITLDDAVVR